jgi:hypothetical protein
MKLLETIGFIVLFVLATLMFFYIVAAVILTLIDSLFYTL